MTQDKTLVMTSLLIVVLTFSATIVPSLAFVYPDGSQDNLFEIYGPRVDQILIKKYASLDSEMEALQAGEIDITDWALTKTWIDTFAADPTVDVVSYGSEAGFYTINFNHNNNPILGNPPDPSYDNPVFPNPASDVEFRQACTYLTDRELLCTGPGEGLYDPIFTPIPAYMSFWIHPDISYTGLLSTLAYPPSVIEAAYRLQNGGFPLGAPDGYRYWDMNENGVYDVGEDLYIIFYSRTDKICKGAADILCAGFEEPLIKIHYTRYEVDSATAWQKVRAEKNYHIYTAGWINIGPDPDYLYDLYHWDNYYHPGAPPNFGSISKYDAVMQTSLEGIRCSSDFWNAQSAAIEFQERFAETACEIPLASASAPKAYRKLYTGGNGGIPIGDGEDKYRGKPWTNMVNEKGLGVNSLYTTLNAYPLTESINPADWTDFGDGNMIMRYGWKEDDMPRTLNPLYSSWYWEYEVLRRVYCSLGGRDPMTKGPMQVPFLADNWTVGQWTDPTDGNSKTAITISIRPDIWWDYEAGWSFTLSDVIYTFIELPRDLRQKGCPDVWFQPVLDQIRGFYELDKYSVRFLMKSNATWSVSWILGTVILPEDIWRNYITDPFRPVAEIYKDFSDEPEMLIGTGPFVYVENTPSSLVLVKNMNYLQNRNMNTMSLNRYDELAQDGIRVFAQPSYLQLSPFRIQEDGTGYAVVEIVVYVTNLDRLHSQTFGIRIDLMDYYGHEPPLENLLEAPNLVLGPGEVQTLRFTRTLFKGGYEIRVSPLMIESGHNYDYWMAHGGGWEQFRHDLWKDFWVTTRGDIMTDGAVDIFDIVTVGLVFGTGIDEWSTWAPRGWYGDVNYDGIIDIFDIVIVAMEFGWTT